MRCLIGKYDKVLANLPKLLGEEPGYQQKVDAVKRKIVEEEPRHATHFAKQYASIRIEKDTATKVLSEINLRLTAYEQLLVDQFENESTHSLTLESGESVRTQPEPYLVVEDPETFRLWCIANGMERELKLQWQTANSLAKERLLDGLDIPEGTRAYNRTKVVFSRG